MNSNEWQYYSPRLLAVSLHKKMNKKMNDQDGHTICGTIMPIHCDLLTLALTFENI